VHKNDLLKNIPFIFLSARSERSDFRKGMDLGADDYITKPFSGAELLNAIDSRLKKIDLLKIDFTTGWEGLQHLAEALPAKEVLRSLTQNRTCNIYKKKQTVYSEGNHPNRLYYVLKGKVKVLKRNEEGKELVTELFSTGDFLGYIALLEGSVYKDTAIAMEDTQLAIIPKEEFEELINNNKEVSLQFIRLLANNIAEKEKQLLGLAYNSLRKKVAEALLALQKKYKEEPEKLFVINISRESLATIAGTATESLIRTLSDFKIEKLITIKEGNISIINQKKLESLAN
jgi:CRP/FNR family transcriptional regulator, cyclic AMP receptor protein